MFTVSLFVNYAASLPRVTYLFVFFLERGLEPRNDVLPTCKVTITHTSQRKLPSLAVVDDVNIG